MDAEEDERMMLTGIEYVFWVFWVVNGKERSDCCFTKRDAERLAERLNAKGYPTRIEQQIA